MSIMNYEKIAIIVLNKISYSFFAAMFRSYSTRESYIYIYMYSMIMDSRYKDHLIPTEIKHTISEIFNEKISSIHSNIPKNMRSNVENTARENGKTIMYV